MQILNLDIDQEISIWYIWHLDQLSRNLRYYEQLIIIKTMPTLSDESSPEDEGNFSEDNEDAEVFGHRNSGTRRYYNNYIKPKIKQNDPRFKELRLDQADVRHFSDSAWERLGHFLDKNDYIEIVNIHIQSTIKYRQSSKTMLLKSVENIKQMRTLSIQGHGFGDHLDHIPALIPALKKSTNLTSLNFRYTSFGERDEDINMLMDALNGSGIKKLSIVWCFLDGNLSAFGKCQLPDLEILDLRFSDIVADGIKTLIPFLKNTNLKRLNLNGNCIGAVGIKALIPFLNNTSKLNFFDISRDLSSKKIKGDDFGLLFDNFLRKESTGIINLKMLRRDRKLNCIMRCNSQTLEYFGVSIDVASGGATNKLALLRSGSHYLSVLKHCTFLPLGTLELRSNFCSE